MKFKGAIIGILTATLAINCLTAYFLISEARAQTEIQATQLKIEMEIAQVEAGMYPENQASQIIDKTYWDAKKIYDKHITFRQ